MTKTEKYVIAAFVAGVLAVAGYSWLQEHDARLTAEIQVKASEARVQDLKSQAAAIDKTTAATVTAIRKQAAAVKTPAEVITAIPKITDAPLNTRPAPDDPAAVEVAAVPLFQALAACRADSVELGACRGKLDLGQKIQDEQAGQIQDLKKPGSFWKRFGKTAEIIGIGAVLGYAAHR